MEGLDIEGAIAFLRKEGSLIPYLDEVVLPPRFPSEDVYSGLISSVVSQQLSVKAAATIHDRFLGLFDSGYPDAEAALALSDEEMRSVGLSGQKMKYVRNVASFFEEKQLFDQDWSVMSDDEIVQLLTEIKGVGEWTVEMILIFVLKRPDVFPVKDLGIQQGMQYLFDIEEEKKALYKKMNTLAEAWRPYRTVASLYLWETKQLLSKD